MTLRYGVVTALYNVIWSYIGYSNANYALSETKNPIRTLKIAAPAALTSVAVIYMFVNVRSIPVSCLTSFLSRGQVPAIDLVIHTSLYPDR